MRGEPAGQRLRFERGERQHGGDASASTLPQAAREAQRSETTHLWPRPTTLASHAPRDASGYERAPARAGLCRSPALPPGEASHAYLFPRAGRRRQARRRAGVRLRRCSPTAKPRDPLAASERVARGAHPDLTWVTPSGAAEMLVAVRPFSVRASPSLRSVSSAPARTCLGSPPPISARFIRCCEAIDAAQHGLVANDLDVAVEVRDMRQAVVERDEVRSVRRPPAVRYSAAVRSQP